ncbi:MAG: ABC transporter ATP-binding protein [Eubacteriales bacterium]|nr:ABC transporter ATP-binding protein [Eubacteriales bacterium]
MKNKERISFIVRFLRGNACCFLLAIITSALVSLLDSVIPQIIRFTVDTLIGGNKTAFPATVIAFIDRLGGNEFLRGHLYYVSAAVIITALFSALFAYLTRVYNSKGSELYTENMRNALFNHINKLPFAWHSDNNTGDIIQRCTSDVETVRNFVSVQLIELIRVFFIVIIALFMMFSIDARVAAVSLAFIPAVIFYSVYFHFRISSQFKEADEAEGVLSTVAQENLTGVRVVRAFGREAFERDKFETANVKLTGMWARLGGILGAFWGISDLTAALQLICVLMFCIKFSADGSVTAGDCIAFISYTAMLSWPIRSLGRIISEMSKAGVSIDRLAYILNEPTEDYADTAEGEGVDFSGDIVFDNVSFSYNKGAQETLSGVSFIARGGQTLGIIGGTGSGKSTVAALLCRLYDTESGEITIGGVPVNKIGRRQIRGNIGIVLQEPYLFSRTLRENITIAINESERSNDSEVRRAADIACIGETIDNLTQGYDTPVGERGVTLSGGQRQRVAIARTVIRRTPVFIFDDSLSAVDTETDAKIRRSLRETLDGTTVIIITHRVSSVLNADRILVLDRGKAVGFGTHAELMAMCGLYREIYAIQQTAGVNR